MVNAKRAVDLAYNYTSATYDDEVLVVPITPTDDTEIWNTFLQEKQYEPNITDWTITELQYCLLDIDQDGRKELILTPGTGGMIFRFIRYIRSVKMKRSIWRMILLHVMDSVILQNIKLLHITATDHRKCLRVWNIMQWTELR